MTVEATRPPKSGGNFIGERLHRDVHLYDEVRVWVYEAEGIRVRLKGIVMGNTDENLYVRNKTVVEVPHTMIRRIVVLKPHWERL